MSKSKAKGTLFENEVRDALTENTNYSITSYRCGEIVGHPGDVEFSVDAELEHGFSCRECGPPAIQRMEGPYYVECKRRASAWGNLYSWLDKNNNDFLALRSDRQRTLVVMDLDQFKTLLLGTLPKPRRKRT